MKPKKRIDIAELTKNPQPLFKFYGIGGLLFFIGFCSILAAEHKFEPSINQELVALGGSLLAGIGFITVMITQGLFIWVRLVRNYRPRNTTND